MKAILEKLSYLFVNRNPSVSDNLTQDQREALIDLLLLCIYADNHAELNEGRILDRELERFNWESEIPIGTYLQVSETRTLAVIPSTDKRAAHLAYISNRLKCKDMKFRALKLCKLLFYSDWVIAEEEELFSKEIRKAFGLVK